MCRLVKEVYIWNNIFIKLVNKVCVTKTSHDGSKVSVQACLQCALQYTVPHALSHTVLERHTFNHILTFA